MSIEAYTIRQLREDFEELDKMTALEVEHYCKVQRQHQRRRA